MHIFASETDCLKGLLPLMKLLFFFPSKALENCICALESGHSVHSAVLPTTEQPGLSECFVVHVETFDLYTPQEIASGCIYSPVYCDLFTE